jgi:SET domain-containing protein
MDAENRSASEREFTQTEGQTQPWRTFMNADQVKTALDKQKCQTWDKDQRVRLQKERDQHVSMGG